MYRYKHIFNQINKSVYLSIYLSIYIYIYKEVAVLHSALTWSQQIQGLDVRILARHEASNSALLWSSPYALSNPTPSNPQSQTQTPNSSPSRLSSRLKSVTVAAKEDLEAFKMNSGKDSNGFGSRD